MACRRPTFVPRLLATLDRQEAIRIKARQLGVVRRQGKVDAFALVAVVVLGVSLRGTTAIAQLGQTLASVTGQRLARSSFWDRFTPAFAKLVRWLLDEHVAEARARAFTPPSALARFKDVIAVDATVVGLHDALAGTWRGTRTNSAVAALKVHAWVRAFTGELLKYRVTSEAFPDCHAFGIDHQIHGCLLLFDKGYSSPSLWRRVASVGGYFLTRLPADRDPRIVAIHRRHRGRSRRAVGRTLRTVLPNLQRAFLDVDAAFRCHVRKYRTRTGHFVESSFRVIAVRQRDGRYELFVTNAPPEMLPAELIADTYRLRWEVETFFKTSKSGLGLDELPSRQPEIVAALVYASLLRASTAMQALARFRRTVSDPMGLPINPGQWVKWWSVQLHGLAAAIVGAGDALSTASIAIMLADPNVRRTTTRTRWSVA